MPKLVPVRAMRGNSGFLRRQEPISPATGRLHDGSLPSQGPYKHDLRGNDAKAGPRPCHEGQFGVPAQAGTHFASDRTVA